MITATVGFVVMILFVITVNSQCTGYTQSFEPQLKAWNVGVETSCQVKQLIMSKKEDALFGSSICNFGDSGGQFFKRNFDLTNIWNIFIDAQPDYNGFAIDQNETNGFLVSEQESEVRLAKLNLTNGNTLEFKRYVNIREANSIATTDSYVFIGAKQASGDFLTVIAIFQASDISFYRELALEASSFITVHQLSSSLAIGYSALGYNSGLRRNLASGSGSTVNFARYNSSSEGTSTLRLSCSTNNCETSTGSRMIELSNGNYLAGVTVNSGTLLLARINADFSTGILYTNNIGTAASYLYRLSEQMEGSLVYALVSNSQQGNIQSSGIRVLIINMSHNKIYAWGLNPFMTFSFAEKYGFVYMGGMNMNSGHGMLLKTIPTSLSLFGGSFTFNYTEYNLEAISDTSYTLSTIPEITTINLETSITTGGLETLNYEDTSETTSALSANSSFYLKGSLFQSVSVISGTNTTADIGYPCSTSENLNLSFEVTKELREF